MSAGDERQERIRVALAGAQDALDGLSEESIEGGAAQGRDHIRHVLSYAQLAAAATDPLLISEIATNELVAAVSAISTDPQAAVQNPDPQATRIIDATLRLPVARGRDIEQSLHDAAAVFQRSAQDRLEALKQRYTEIDKRFDEADKQADGIQQRIAEVESSMAATRAEFDTMLQRHSGEFIAAQEARAKEFQSELHTLRDELGRLHTEAREEVESRVAEIRRMEQESSALVGAIGLAGTAERFGEEVVQQKRAADWMRWLTIALALGAVVMSVYAVIKGDQEPAALVAKLAVSVVLGGLAAYTASQSARHRRREERARALQLELTAFAPFIEPLEPEQREEERVIMTRRTFGHAIGSDGPADDPRPSPTSFLLRRRQKELEKGGT